MPSTLLVPRGQAADLVRHAIALVKIREHIKVHYVSKWREKLARKAQLAPLGKWLVWIFLAGRGAGKTRSGAEWTHEKIREGCKRVALVAATASDVRDTMIEGEAGILATCPEDLKPILYEPSKRKVTYGNGAELHLYSAEEPNRLRGPSHDSAWCDEVCFWKGIDEEGDRNPWDMLMFTLRLGKNPQVMVSTTPLPLTWLINIMKRKSTVSTHSTTYENIKNLAKIFIDTVIKAYEGTRLGEQELNAIILKDIPGALWTAKMISDAQLDSTSAPDMEVFRVAVDPAVTDKVTSAETGIIVGGRAPCACQGEIEDHAFIFDDLSLKASPGGWALQVARGFDEYEADRVIGEVNNGGDLVEVNLRTKSPHIPYKSVHATRGKYKRAEPISALYEQGKVHHVGPRGKFATLEDQLAKMTADGRYKLIDRADALVWLLTDLMLTGKNVWRAH